MGTAFPAAGTSHAFAHLIETYFDPALSGFSFFGRGHPTNPLIPRQGSNILP